MSQISADKEIKVKWRLINPVLLAPVVIIILLTAMFVHPSPQTSASEVAREYFKTILFYFYPYGLKHVQVASYLAVQILWFCCYFMSMQPFDLKARKIGSILGVIMSIVWMFLVTGAALTS